MDDDDADDDDKMMMMMLRRRMMIMMMMIMMMMILMMMMVLISNCCTPSGITAPSLPTLLQGPICCDSAVVCAFPITECAHCDLNQHCLHCVCPLSFPLSVSL